MSKTPPVHIGIIMDGNRRWAKSQNKPTLEGHRQGYEKVKKVGDWCVERGIKVLSVYAFSTENWNRSKREVNYLMRLLHQGIVNDTDELHAKGIKMVFSGRLSQLSGNIRQAIDKAVEKTKHNTKGILNLCINYGGRSEMVDAMKEIIKKKLTPAQITEATIAKHIYEPALPDPDLIIRTSGEQRLSGFQTWRSVYSELFFVKKHWPAFSEKDLDGVLAEFNKRTRRYGGN